MFNEDIFLKEIAIHSGNLAGKLSRIDETLNTKLIAQAFKYSIQNGGLDELEFKRPSGQSYNPRPARVALILIESNAKITTENLIACFYSCCRKELLTSKKEVTINAIKISEDSFKFSDDFKEKSKDSIYLAMALHLDHARHLHLGKMIDEISQNKDFCEKTKKLILIAEKENTYFHQTMQHWLRRHQSKYKLQD